MILYVINCGICKKVSFAPHENQERPCKFSFFINNSYQSNGLKFRSAPYMYGQRYYGYHICITLGVTVYEYPQYGKHICMSKHAK